MILYRLSRFASDTFPLIALGAYMLMFVLVFICVFIMPPAGLILFFLTLATLPMTWAFGRGFQALASGFALRSLHGGRCPECGRRMQTVRDETKIWQCEHCETRFMPDGHVVDDRMIETGADETGPAAAALA